MIFPHQSSFTNKESSRSIATDLAVAQTCTSHPCQKCSVTVAAVFQILAICVWSCKKKKVLNRSLIDTASSLEDLCPWILMWFLLTTISRGQSARKTWSHLLSQESHKGYTQVWNQENVYTSLNIYDQGPHCGSQARSSLLPVFSEHSCVYLLTCCLWLLSCFHGRVEELRQRSRDPQSLTCLPLASSRKSCPSPDLGPDWEQNYAHILWVSL